MGHPAAKAENRELLLEEQDYGADPLADRDTNLYRGEYVKSFVEKWDELIDWDARAESEGRFFMDILHARGKETVLDVACGTGFHSVRLTKAGFNVTSADGSAAMLAKAFENGKRRGLILKTVQADWRWLNRDINGRYDAVVCLGNSFTHLHDEQDRRRALAEFYAALKHDGILILDQRNYDAMLDHGFSSKHKFYYCGEKVTAEPEHIDDGLARFKYTFPDGSEYSLNMFPLRKNYTRRLLSEAGFERVRTYGDFQETYQDDEPDFFVHVAEKAAMTSNASSAGAQGAPREAADEVVAKAEAYYDSDDADVFYQMIWGGEDIHVGCYEETEAVKAASIETVDRMAGLLTGLDAAANVIDLGAGYGGSARRLAKRFDCRVSCLNISDAQNDTNRHKNRLAGLQDKVKVVHGSYEAIPEADGTFDVVWSQDAILHSARRKKVLAEAFRVLKPGGEMVFTDPMQADDADPAQLTKVYERIGLADMGSFKFYREAAEELGFEVLDQIDLTQNLRTHYDRVRQELESNYATLRKQASGEYLDNMLVGLQRWVEAADNGQLAWGIQRFRKPA